MTKPLNVKVPTKIGSDVYIRDNEDPTVQMKAKVYEVNFADQTADVGFYPEREGQPPAELQLPDAYRATIPLTELSLQPHSGAKQVGYAEALMAAGVDAATLGWTDNIGGVHAYGPGAIKQVVGDDVPQPEFGADVADNTGPGGAVLIAPLASVHGKVPFTAEPSVRQPLFTKTEILAKIAESEAVAAQLRRMIESL